jgi:hypothetical protein
LLGLKRKSYNSFGAAACGIALAHGPFACEVGVIQLPTPIAESFGAMNGRTLMSIRIWAAPSLTFPLTTCSASSINEKLVQPFADGGECFLAME